MAKVVKFYGSNCSPCQTMAPIYEKVVESLKNFGGNHTYESKNIGEEGVRELAMEAGIRMIPSYVVYMDSGEIRSRSGLMSERGLQDFLWDAIDGVEEKQEN